MPKKIVIAAGGSGGHLYPATGLARQLLQNKNIQLQFVAAGLASNPFFNREEFHHQSISSGTFPGWSPLPLLRACKNLSAGFFQSRRILSTYNPNLVIGFGSYHSFPLLLAARSLAIPIALHEQNSKPGKVIRMFSKKAVVTGVYFPSAISLLHGNCVKLAMPLRDGYQRESCRKEHACEYFDLNPAKLTLLAFGGSQGAQFVNHVVSEALVRLALQGANFQVLHFTGDAGEVDRLQKHYQSVGIEAVVKKFEENMQLAWRAADFCITRAGAGTIAEMLEFEVPGILIPYPYSADGHQDSNADYLVDIVGGGWKFLESQIDADTLAAFCLPLLKLPHLVLKEKQQQLKLHRHLTSRQEFASVIGNILEET